MLGTARRGYPSDGSRGARSSRPAPWGSGKWKKKPKGNFLPALGDPASGRGLDWVTHRGPCQPRPFCDSSFERRILLTRLGELLATVQNQTMRRNAVFLRAPPREGDLLLSRRAVLWMEARGSCSTFHCRHWPPAQTTAEVLTVFCSAFRLLSSVLYFFPPTRLSVSPRVHN